MPGFLKNAFGAARCGADYHVMLQRLFVPVVLLTLIRLTLASSALAQAPGRAPTQSLQPRATQPQQPVPQQPQAPFTLSPQEQQTLDNILATWEQQSQRIETLQCQVHRWEHNRVFKNSVRGVGDLRYRAPDKGLYRIDKFDESTEKIGDPLDHWICDGLSIFEFNYAAKQLIERPLPPELQGKAIANGPLPFMFGAQASDLKRRYWMRLVAPPDAYKDKLCIEAYPKHQHDAANFSRAIFVMDPEKWIPLALLLDMPNGQSQTTHVFTEVKVNEKEGWFEADFAKPRTPFGWKRVVEQPEALVDSPAGLPPAQARQTAPQSDRR